MWYSKKKSLDEYAAQHPQEPSEQERAAMIETANAIQTRQEERDRAVQLQASILTQLQQGNAPQSILYTALTAIGLLTHDEEWTTAAKVILDSVYADLEQQSLWIDNAAVEAQRLEQMQVDYYEKLRRQLTRQLSTCQRVEKSLNEVLMELPAPKEGETSILRAPFPKN